MLRHYTTLYYVNKNFIYLNVHFLIMKTKRIYSTLDVETYNLIKQMGIKLNSLIKIGLECIRGNCSNEKNKVINEKDKEIENLKNEIVLLKKELEKYREARKDSMFLNYVFLLILKKYNIDIVKEVSEIIKDEEVKNKVLGIINNYVLKR